MFNPGNIRGGKFFLPNFARMKQSWSQSWKDLKIFRKIRVHISPFQGSPGSAGVLAHQNSSELSHPRPSRTDDRKTWIEGYDPSEATSIDNRFVAGVDFSWVPGGSRVVPVVPVDVLCVFFVGGHLGWMDLSDFGVVFCRWHELEARNMRELIYMNLIL